MARSRMAGADLLGAWDDLADRVAASPFHRPGWFTAWWSAFGAGRPEVVRSYRGARLVGVLPLAHRRGVVHGMDNDHTFTFGPLAEDGAALADLFDGLLDRVRYSAVLGHLAVPDYAALQQSARSRGFLTSSFIQQRSPYISTGGDFDTYRKGLDARWLRQLERRRRQLAGAGELELSVLDGSTDLKASLDEAFRVEAMGWKSEAGTAILSRPETRVFYTELSRWAAARDSLRIAFLRLDGTVIAADLCLEDAGVHYFLKTGFDPAHRATAPGLILRHDMIRRAFDIGLHGYELLGDAEPYKLRWTQEMHEIRRLVTYPRSAGGLAARAARGIASRAHRAVERIREREPSPASGAAPHRARTAAGDAARAGPG